MLSENFFVHIEAKNRRFEGHLKSPDFGRPMFRRDFLCPLKHNFWIWSFFKKLLLMTASNPKITTLDHWSQYYKKFIKESISKLIRWLDVCQSFSMVYRLHILRQKSRKRFAHHLLNRKRGRRQSKPRFEDSLAKGRSLRSRRSKTMIDSLGSM